MTLHHHAEYTVIRARQRFTSVRHDSWPGLSGFVPADELGEETRWLFATRGHGTFNGRPVSLPNASRMRFPVDQIPVDPDLLQFEARRPRWGARLLGAMGAKADLSPAAYPHSASDVLRACNEFARRDGDFAVWSSISPWLELTLLRWGARSVTTVDLNEPLLPPSEAQLRTLSASNLAARYANGTRFDAIVSFSGFEHDGLGRYGDPIHPDGDLAAVRETRLFLRPNGLLLLALPTAPSSDVAWPLMRVYGPERLARILEGFELLGRCWNGKVVRGGLSANASEPALFASPTALRWQHQQVLVLRRVGGDEVADDAATARAMPPATLARQVARLRAAERMSALRRKSYPGWSTDRLSFRSLMPRAVKRQFAAWGGRYYGAPANDFEPSVDSGAAVDDAAAAKGTADIA